MKLKVNSVSIVVTEPEIIVAHAVKTHECEFEFDETWNDYTKKAVFKKGSLVVKVLLKDNKCIIPWEVLETRGFLKIGIRGVCDDKRRPTVWTDNILISDGPGESEPGKEPTPTLYQQMVDVMEETKAIAQSVRDDADAGKFGGGGGLTVEEVKEVVRETAITQEQDPTVPNWAKQSEKPTYSYAEITDKPEDLATEKYADDVSKQAVSQGVTAHNISQDTHKDIRNLINELSNRLNAIADSDDKTLDQLSEIVAYIKANKALIESVTTSKVNVSDIVNDLETNVANKPLSASQGVVLKGLITTLEQSLSSLTDKTNSLAENAVRDIGAEVSEETNELTIELKDKNGKVIKSVKVTLPTQEIPEPDLTEYVTFTDYVQLAQGGKPKKAGVISIDPYYGFTIGQAGSLGDLIASFANDSQLKSRYSNRFIGSHNMDKAVATVLTDSKVTLTDEEKTSACGFLGATRWYLHDTYLDSSHGEFHINFISPSPNATAYWDVPYSLLTGMVTLVGDRNHLIIGCNDDRTTLYALPIGAAGSIIEIYVDGITSDNVIPL